LAEIIYDKINKTAVLVPIDGGCGCVPACYNYTLTNEDFSSTDTVTYTDCSGSASSIDVFPSSVISICAQQGTASSQYGYVQISENGTC
jgi:hypothetical protein